MSLTPEILPHYTTRYALRSDSTWARTKWEGERAVRKVRVIDGSIGR